MANTIYRGFEIRRNEDGTHSWEIEPGKWRCGYVDLLGRGDTFFNTEEEAMSDIDEHKRKFRA